MAGENSRVDLAQLFQSVAGVMEQNRTRFNTLDGENGNHGDHMARVFQVAAKAAQGKQAGGLEQAMEYAARLLEAETGNASAQVYAHGLQQLATRLRQYGVSFEDLVPYVQGLMTEAVEINNKPAASGNSGEVLKALGSALMGWQQVEAGQEPAEKPLDMGSLFEIGMAYMQAKQRGGSRIEVLADAAASASPLSQVPHRYESGKLAIATLLQGLGQ